MQKINISLPPAIFYAGPGSGVQRQGRAGGVTIARIGRPTWADLGGGGKGAMPPPPRNPSRGAIFRFAPPPEIQKKKKIYCGGPF